MDSSKLRRRPRDRSALSSDPASEGLTPLDRSRAASLADEGGAAAASIESQDLPEHGSLPRGRTAGGQGNLLCEVSIIPLGGDIHLSDELGAILNVIDASGLSYQLGPAGTCIEGSWEQVMPVVRACHQRARSMSKHVITLVKIEDDEGERDKIRRNVESVESKAGRTLRTSNAGAEKARSSP